MRSVTNMMAMMVGMKLSIRGSGVVALGATAAYATSVMTTTANANWRCRAVGGNVATEYSNSSSAVRFAAKTCLPGGLELILSHARGASALGICATVPAKAATPQAEDHGEPRERDDAARRACRVKVGRERRGGVQNRVMPFAGEADRHWRISVAKLRVVQATCALRQPVRRGARFASRIAVQLAREGRHRRKPP